MMRIVNCTKEVCTHYCGRFYSYNRSLGNPINLSILGNPFPVGEKYDLEESLSLYAQHLYDELIQDKSKSNAYWQALRSIPDDAVLGCFCAPKKCHCSIIKLARKYIL